MVAPVLMILTVLLVLVGLVRLALGHERVDETDRFNRAREITTSWADADHPAWLDLTDGEHGPEPRVDAPDAGPRGRAR
jgi:hypothetical protein